MSQRAEATRIATIVVDGLGQLDTLLGAQKLPDLTLINLARLLASPAPEPIAVDFADTQGSLSPPPPVEVKASTAKKPKARSKQTKKKGKSAKASAKDDAPTASPPDLPSALRKLPKKTKTKEAVVSPPLGGPGTLYAAVLQALTVEPTNVQEILQRVQEQGYTGPARVNEVCRVLRTAARQGEPVVIKTLSPGETVALRREGSPKEAEGGSDNSEGPSRILNDATHVLRKAGEPLSLGDILKALQRLPKYKGRDYHVFDSVVRGALERGILHGAPIERRASRLGHAKRVFYAAV